VQTRWSLMVLVLLGSMASAAVAQFQEGPPGGAKLGEASVQRWRAGMIVTASGGACKGIAGYVALPMEWPEQQVKIVEEDITPQTKVTYQLVDGTANLMVVKIASLPSGEQAKAVVTLEIRRSAVVPPDDTGKYLLPDPKKLDRKVRPYLGPSPFIESQSPKIRSLAKEIGADKEKAWDRVRAIYDWVREKVKYKDGKLKGALAALEDGTGDCEELTSLFIAICRAANIPARTVWVPGHCYPEFYLVDEKDEGHWFPCQAAGSEAFGGIPEHRPILQKGDNFRPPYNRRDHQRYLAEYLTGTPTPGGGRPQVKFVRELVSQ